MEQETKVKSEKGQVQRTTYEQEGQTRPDQEQPQQVPPQKTAVRPQSQRLPEGQVQRTIYGQDGQSGMSQGPAQETLYGQGDQGAPHGQEGQGNQTPVRGSRPQQGQGVPYGQGSRGTSYGQGSQGTSYGQGNQAPVRGSRPHSQGNQAPVRGNRPQGQGTPYGQGNQTPVRGSRLQQGQGSQGTPHGQGNQTPVRGNRPQGQGTPYGQGVPYGQGGQGSPYGQGNQAPVRGSRPQQGQGSQRVPARGNAAYGRGGQMQGGRPAYGQDGRAADPYRPQGTMVQRRDGRMPARMAPRTELFGRRLAEQSRKMFRSPIFLIMAVFCSVSSVMTIASVLLQELGFSQVLSILANFDMPSELMSYVNRVLSFVSGLGSSMIAVSLILHLPELLLCAGFWILIASAGRKGAPMTGTGFLCTKIYIIIKMIISCIVMLICLILSVVLTVSAWLSADSGTKMVTAVFLALVIAVTMMIIMYFFCLLHTVKVCRANAIQGDSFSSVSRYAAVLTILAALFSVIGLLSAIVNAELAGIVSFACKIGWMVLAGLWILIYRSKINGDTEE